MRPQRPIPNGKVGFAWHVDDMTGVIFGMEPFVWHNGGTGGFSSYMALQPKERIGVVVLADRSNATAVDGLGLQAPAPSAQHQLRAITARPYLRSPS